MAKKLKKLCNNSTVEIARTKCGKLFHVQVYKGYFDNTKLLDFYIPRDGDEVVPVAGKIKRTIETRFKVDVGHQVTRYLRDER
tara:strand:+ start:241 stop:489 length:249 start_codon:yes stop_codon:yes gene_type:complete